MISAPPAAPDAPLSLPEMLQESLAAAEHLLPSFGVLSVQLDAYVSVAGRLNADEERAFLQEAYRRLRACLRVTDLVAGGDNGIFFVVARALRTDQMLDRLCERIVRVGRKPYDPFDGTLRSGFTVGAVLAPRRMADPSLLIRQAAAAMYEASARGESSMSFDEPMLDTQMLLGEGTGSSAAVLDELPVHQFTPQFSRGGALCGIHVSTLIESPRGSLPLSHLLCRIVDQELSMQVGERVLREVFEQVHRWHSRGLTVPSLSLDVHKTHLLHPEFTPLLLALLEEFQIAPATIHLLVTESAISIHAEATARVVSGLAATGIRFTLCNTSLRASDQLRTLPFSSMRLSCASIFNLPRRSDGEWMARSMVAVAERLGLALEVHDVSSEDQRATLSTVGCEALEGSLFRSLVTAPEMERLLSA